MNYSKIIKKAAPLLCILLLAACGKEEPAEAVMGDVSIREAVTTAQPQTAVEEIYETLPDARIQSLAQGLFRELFSGLESSVEEYYGCISDPTGGLADVLIIQPAEDREGNSKASRDAVRDALRRYQEKRIQEFENYDILNSFTIANGAEVYDQGNYVILLMLPDNEAAREIIDRYIPL